jgi:uncharacterized membrane protein
MGFRKFVINALIRGVIVLVPIYLGVLLLLRAMDSLRGLVRPLARLLPKGFPAQHVLSLLLVLSILFLVGLAVHTSIGRAAQQMIENSLLEKMPGYQLFRNLIQQMAGETREKVWKPALAEIEEALVPAFIIEELDDGQFTVFVPSSPTPIAGSIFILSPERVHPLNVSFAQAIKAMTQWGSGCKDLVAAMKTNHANREGFPKSPIARAKV